MIALTAWTFFSKVMSLLLNMLSGFVIVFLPRSKYLLISQLQSLSAVILEPKKIKSVTVTTFSPSICHEVMGPDTMIFFLILSFKPAFSLSSFTLISGLFSSSSGDYTYSQTSQTLSLNLVLLQSKKKAKLPPDSKVIPSPTLLVAQMVLASAYNAGDLGSIPGSGRSPEEGNGHPLQYSCLENPMDGGARQATVPGVSRSWTRLSNFTFFLSFLFHKVKKGLTEIYYLRFLIEMQLMELLFIRHRIQHFHSAVAHSS